MPKAWVTDRWIKDNVVRDESGAIIERHSPTGRQLQAIKSLPERFRSEDYGRGRRWRVEWLEDVPGHPRRRRTESFAEKRDADARQAELEQGLRAGTYVTPDQQRQIFRDVAEMWFNSRQKIGGSTRRRYRTELDRYVLPKFGDRTLNSITEQMVEEWVVELREGRAPHEFKIERKQSALGASTIDHTVNIVFGSVMRYAQRKRWLVDIPVVELPTVDEEQDSRKALNHAELKALADAAYNVAQSEQDRTLVYFLAFSGLRIGEALQLKVRDVDLTTLRVDVRGTFTEDEEGNRVEGRTKSRKARIVPIPRFVADKLEPLTVEKAGAEYLFRTSTGTALNDHNWRYRVFGKAVEGAGLGGLGLTPHAMRHTAASMAITAGADVLLVAQMLGHANPSVTLGIYSHLWPDRMDEVSAAMAAHHHAAVGLEATTSALRAELAEGR